MAAGWPVVLSFGAVAGGGAGAGVVVVAGVVVDVVVVEDGGAAAAGGCGFFLNIPFIPRKTLLEVLSARVSASEVTELDLLTTLFWPAVLMLVGMFLIESPTWAAQRTEPYRKTKASSAVFTGIREGIN